MARQHHAMVAGDKIGRRHITVIREFGRFIEALSRSDLVRKVILGHVVVKARGSRSYKLCDTPNGLELKLIASSAVQKIYLVIMPDDVGESRKVIAALWSRYGES